MGEERVFIPLQLGFMALLLAGFFVVLLSYFTNPEVTVGMMGQLLDAMTYFKAKLNEHLWGLGTRTIIEGVSGDLINASGVEDAINAGVTS